MGRKHPKLYLHIHFSCLQRQTLAVGFKLSGTFGFGFLLGSYFVECLFKFSFSTLVFIVTLNNAKMIN